MSPSLVSTIDDSDPCDQPIVELLVLFVLMLLKESVVEDSQLTAGSFLVLFWTGSLIFGLVYSKIGWSSSLTLSCSTHIFGSASSSINWFYLRSGSSGLAHKFTTISQYLPFLS